MLKANDIHKVITMRANDHGVEAIERDGFAVSVAARHDAYYATIQLPRTRGQFQLSIQSLMLMDAPTLVDTVDHEIASAAAHLRGFCITNWIDKGLPIDFLHNSGEDPLHERAERIGLKLGELSDLLMRRAR